MTNYAVMSDFNTGLFISNQWAAVRTRTQADTGTIAIITVVRGTIANNMCLRILPSSAVFTFLPQTCSSPAAVNFTWAWKLGNLGICANIFSN